MLTHFKFESPVLRPAGERFAVEAAAPGLGVRWLGMRPEAQLLLACARTWVDDATAEHIRILLRGNVNWDYVVEQAERHRVVPLLCQSLTEVCPELVPSDILKDLRDYTTGNAHYNLYRTGELIKLLRLFEANGIPALPFKGPVLSASAYGNLSLRQYADLDILVRPRDVLATMELLQSSGYRLATSLKRTQTNRQFLPRNKDLIFETPNGLLRLELHWRLSGKHFGFSLDLNRLWDRLKTVTLAGVAVPTLAEDDLLLYLCMHGSRHGWERLLWICDVAELIRGRERVFWEHVLRNAALPGCERMLGLGLLLAQEFLGAELPEDIKEKFRNDSELRSLAAQLRESLFREPDASAAIGYWYDFHLRVRERLRDRLRLHLYYYGRYWRLAVRPNERDRAILELPTALSFFYYLVRPFRLVKTLFRSSKSS